MGRVRRKNYRRICLTFLSSLSIVFFGESLCLLPAKQHLRDRWRRLKASTFILYIYQLHFHFSIMDEAIFSYVKTEIKSHVHFHACKHLSHAEFSKQLSKSITQHQVKPPLNYASLRYREIISTIDITITLTGAEFT